MTLTKQLGMLAASVTFISTTAMADTQTFNFESDYLSNTPFDQIIGLDLNQATSSTFSLVVADPFSTQPGVQEVKNFKLHFENAPSLTVSSLRRTDSPFVDCWNSGNSAGGQAFYGEVNSAWIFRTVEVVLCTPYDMGMPFADFSYSITVKDMDSYNVEPFQPGVLRLIEGRGTALDKTPNKVADVERVTVFGKSLKLNLLQRMGEANIPNYGTKFGFVINAAWLGYGDKPIVVESYNATPMAKAIAIDINVIPAPAPELEDELWISVRYEDETGTQFNTMEQNLMMLLEESYGPLMP